MDLIDPLVGALLDGSVPERPLVMREMEQRARDDGFPIIGPAAGHFCYLVARMVGATKVFELGSGYGYSTAWFARAVTENGGGTVDHVVWDEKLSSDARTYLEDLGYGGIVRFTLGEAVEALRSSSETFDLIFCDIDKKAYPEALEAIGPKLRPGGVLITDNVLWSGRIFDEADESPETEAIREFTRQVTTNPAWSASIVPIRDGLLVAIRNGG